MIASKRTGSMLLTAMSMLKLLAMKTLFGAMTDEHQET